jgi:lipoprotein-anchoring transpeptidase ErfK/SrfK
MNPSFPRAGISAGLRARAAAAIVASCTALIALTPAVASAHTKPAPSNPCPHRAGRVVCVDQDHQRMWVQQGSEVIFDPVLIRTGYRGMWTPNGTFHVYARHEWPNSPLLPYSQFFYRLYALHGSRDDLHKGKSKGCVNMSVSDARRLWRTLNIGDTVYIWGHKPGT